MRYNVKVSQSIANEAAIGSEELQIGAPVVVFSYPKERMTSNI